MKIISLSNVYKTYKTGTKALKNINIEIEEGEFVFIMGHSGSGKTSLFRLLTKEMEPDEGSITVRGQDLSKIKRRHIPKYRRGLGVVFQDFRLLQDRNVYENVAFAQRVIGIGSKRIKESVPEVLQKVGLSAKYKSKPTELSGGEKQRTAIARALINNPDILLCDEPTGNLDKKNAKGIMKLLEEINARGTTVVVITHSEELVREMKKRVIIIDKGSVINDKRVLEDEN